ncbi:uncharacterized protein BDR25DRAFT_371206 [Lindgomyces ingoldianus]|uniref:Uncharacterized protein n=1 Tax=Lindgomyces ingoldianus TaxID=673940 RepID=A0ACB6RCX9_9PLEO|nr:uncharacterized protein BDR25DRAFT_371206 [Lindgomyces ingoldianus]KAF2477198.1 hypothetical protein BDR25DRAFT_371206 [Lindgomyces ingoldianus]
MNRNGRAKKRGSAHPYLTGNFAPVTITHSPVPCSYTGTVPLELLGGEYVRNGGNPVSNSDLGRDAHWFDGDGMLAGVFFKPSHSDPEKPIPHFVNQYILTDICLSSLESPSLRTPILPSIATLVNPLSSLIVTIFCIFRSVFLVLLSHLPRSQQVINRISVANTGVLFHDRRALATCESGPPIRIQLPGLETVGWYHGNRTEGEPECRERSQPKEEVFGGSGLFSFMKEWTTGHPKVDPWTGEMILFHCTFLPPYVHYSVIPPCYTRSLSQRSKQLNTPVPGCSGGKMMHDFGVSLSHTVILDLPLSLTPFNLFKNEPVISYKPDKPSRFGVFPRHDPSRVRWFETSGCCIFHTANTWDEYDAGGVTTAVNLLTCRLTSSSLVFSAGNLPLPPQSKQDALEKSRLMSFFAKYDDEAADLEKDPAQETTPLLSPAYPAIVDDDEEQCRLYYHRFSLTASTPTVSHQYALSHIPFEFPTLNPAYEMSSARYIYGCSTSSESFGAALGKATKIDVLVKMDVQTLLRRGELCPACPIGRTTDSTEYGVRLI